MARARQHAYIDIELSRDKMKKLKAGKAIHFVLNGTGKRLALRMKDASKEREIKKLKARIRELRKKAK